MSKIYTKQNKYLNDALIYDIQCRIAEDLQIDNVFGKCEKKTIKRNEKEYLMPVWYAGKNDYILISPDDTQLKNFCFFIVDDAQNVELKHDIKLTIKSKFSIIFWFDYRTLQDADERNNEKIKYDILQCLRNVASTYGNISITKIYEEVKNVFYGFDLKEIDNQFLTMPFGGFRFEGEMITKQC